MAKKKKTSETELEIETQGDVSENAELIEKALEEPKDHTSEWIPEDQEEIQVLIQDHPKFHKFKKPLEGIE